MVFIPPNDLVCYAGGTCIASVCAYEQFFPFCLPCYMSVLMNSFSPFCHVQLGVRHPEPPAPGPDTDG